MSQTQLPAMQSKSKRILQPQVIVKTREMTNDFGSSKTNFSLPSTPAGLTATRITNPFNTKQNFRKKTPKVATKGTLAKSQDFMAQVKYVKQSSRSGKVWPFNSKENGEESELGRQLQAENQDQHYNNIDQLLKYHQDHETLDDEEELDDFNTNLKMDELERQYDRQHQTRSRQQFGTTQSQQMRPTTSTYDVHGFFYDEKFFNLPEELRSQPIFRRIYSRKSTKSPHKIIQQDPMQKFSKTLQNFEKNPKFFKDKPIEFYQISKVGYKNYKYPKSNPLLDKPRKPNKSEANQTIEHAIRSIYNQKIISQNKDNNPIIKKIKQEEERMAKSKTEAKLRSTQEFKPATIQSPKNNLTSLPEGQTMMQFDEQSKTYQPYNTANFFKPSSGSPLKALRQRPGTQAQQQSSEQNFYFRRTFVPDFRTIINDKKSSFKDKQLEQEYIYFVKATKKFLQEQQRKVKESSGDQDQKAYILHQIGNAMEYEGIIAKIFVDTQEIFKNNRVRIIERILLAFDINPQNPYFLVEWNNFRRFKDILVFKDASAEDMIEFVIKFFNPDQDTQLKVEEFLRVLKLITDRIDVKMSQNAANTLFDNFVENFQLTGIVKKNSEIVDFERFRQVYLSNKMNVFDLIDLISS